MSSNPAEPDKYSLDEMLERLQAKPTNEADDAGELVTRADGSQAIKVRKRKRRSTQPHKEIAKKNLRLRAIQVSSVVIFAILIILGFGGLLVYSNSGAYRQNVFAKFNAATGAETEINQLRVNPTGTTAAYAKFTWPAGSTLKSLMVNDLRAQALIGGVVGSRWSVNEVTAAKATLVIGSPEGGQPIRFTPKPESSPVSMQRLGISDTDVLFGDPAAPALHLAKAEASFYPSNVNKIPSIRLFRGEVRIPNWPAFRMDRSLIEFPGDRIDIVNMRILHELDNVGNIELSGKIDPSSVHTTQSLDVKMNSFNLNGIAGNSLGHIVAGRVDSTDADGKNQLTFSSLDPGGKLRVSFASTPNNPPRLNNFPFLGKLTQITENPWFLDALFHDGCTGTLERQDGIVSFTNLSMTSRTHFKVIGNLVLQPNDLLSGALQIGLPEATIVGSKNPKLAGIFTDSRDGFRWINLVISGTGSRPIDNFAEIADAAPIPAEEIAPQDAFEKLTAPKPE